MSRHRASAVQQGARTIVRSFDLGEPVRVSRSQSNTEPSGADTTTGYDVPAAGLPVPMVEGPRADSTVERSRPRNGGTVASNGGGSAGADPELVDDAQLLRDISSIVSGSSEPSPSAVDPLSEVDARPQAPTPQPKSSVSASPPPTSAPQAGGVPKAKNGQDIFDQIAASMSRAKSYDLGAVELADRFDSFDQTVESPPSRRSTAPIPVESRPLGTAEVIEDIDQILTMAEAQSDIPLDPGVGGRSIGGNVLEPGDIILSTTTELVSAAIRTVSGAEVSHAAMYVGDDIVVEAVGDGVRAIRLAEALDDDSLAVAYRHRDMTPVKAAQIVRFLNEQADAGTSYDGWALLQVAPGQLARAICNRLDGDDRQACLSRAGQLRVGTNNEGAFFCSELVLEALRRAGLSLSGVDPSWTSPGEIVELHASGLLDYVGHLKG